MFLDISQFGCQYCYDLAAEMNANSELQSLVAAGKCSTVTVVPELSQWKAKFAGTPTAEHSYASKDAYNVSTKFGQSPVSGTPAVYVINIATGKVESTSRDVKAFVNMCK